MTPGTYNLVVTGTSGSEQFTVNPSLTVKANARFWRFRAILGDSEFNDAGATGDGDGDCGIDRWV